MEQGFSCSESVLLAASQRLGIESEIVPHIATGFSGGMGLTAMYSCFAVIFNSVTGIGNWGSISPNFVSLHGVKTIPRN